MAGGLLFTGGGFVGLSCFLPWFSISVNLAGISLAAHEKGIDTGAGKIVLGLSLAALALAALGRRGWSVGAGLAGAGLVLYKSMYYKSQFTDVTGVSHTSFGTGTWVALLGGLALAAGAYVARREDA
jgi:hypothetical protein